MPKYFEVVTSSNAHIESSKIIELNDIFAFYAPNDSISEVLIKAYNEGFLFVAISDEMIVPISGTKVFRYLDTDCVYFLQR